MKFDIVKEEWFIIYIEGSQVVISKNLVHLSLKMDFFLSKQCRPRSCQLVNV